MEKDLEFQFHQVGKLLLEIVEGEEVGLPFAYVFAACTLICVNVAVVVKIDDVILADGADTPNQEFFVSRHRRPPKTLRS